MFKNKIFIVLVFLLTNTVYAMKRSADEVENLEIIQIKPAKVITDLPKEVLQLIFANLFSELLSVLQVNMEWNEIAREDRYTCFLYWGKKFSELIRPTDLDKSGLTRAKTAMLLLKMRQIVESFSSTECKACFSQRWWEENKVLALRFSRCHSIDYFRGWLRNESTLIIFIGLLATRKDGQCIIENETPRNKEFPPWGLIFSVRDIDDHLLLLRGDEYLMRFIKEFETIQEDIKDREKILNALADVAMELCSRAYQPTLVVKILL